MNRQSLFIATVAIFALAPLTTACGSDDSGYGPVSTAPDNILQVDIDTDQKLQADPGKGVGVFVEYAAGGSWHIYATCDTDSSNFDCSWDMIASIDPTLSLGFMDDGDLEKGDSITRVDKGAVRMVFDVASDFDGAVLTAPAGKRLRLDVNADPDPSLVNWSSDGVIKTSAPSDPLDFLPTSP